MNISLLVGNPRDQFDPIAVCLPYGPVLEICAPVAGDQ